LAGNILSNIKNQIEYEEKILDLGKKEQVTGKP